MRDTLVKIAIKLGCYKWIVEQINKVKFEIQARRMRKDGLEMLASADKAFTEIGVQAFLTYGALLGAYRDHGFISYDPDIDLGVLSDELPEDLDQRLKVYGFQLVRCNYLGNADKTIFERTYQYKNLHLDVFSYFKEGNDYYSIVQRKHEHKDWKEANATDGFPVDRSYVPACTFERRPFLGLNIFMPVDTDGWLRAIYSDSYMTPIKNWTKEGYVTRIIHVADRSFRRLF